MLRAGSGRTIVGRSTRGVRVLVDRLKLLAAAMAVVVLAKTFVVDVVVVEGNSMLPTIRSGDWVLVEKLTPRLRLLRPGHIVLMTATQARVLILKRIVAVGGQYVELAHGRVTVNGHVSPTEAARIPGGTAWAPTLVPAGNVFVLGDNRAHSEDSSDFGPVPVSQIKGRVMPLISGWTSALASHLGGSLPGGRWPREAERSRNVEIRPGLAATALGAMSQVETAHVMVGDAEIWISATRGVRIDAARGSTLVTHDATWEYDRNRSQVTVLDGVPPASASWMYLERFAGVGWLQSLAYDGSKPECAVLDYALSEEATTRIEARWPGDDRGATLWLDGETARVVKIDQWRIEAGVRHATFPTIRVDYVAPEDPKVFVPSFPPDARVVDRRMRARAVSLG